MHPLERRETPCPSIEVVIAGYQKKNAILTDEEKRIVAYHEVARAMITRYGMSEDFGMVAMETVENACLGGDAVGSGNRIAAGNPLAQSTRRFPVLNILVTLDKNYLPPLKTLLTSLLVNHPCDVFDIYLASDDLTEDDLGDVATLCSRFGSALHLIHVKDEWFADAPTLRYYSRAMYYRLLAAEMLPKDMDRILYLDPDMLVINSLRPLYETKLGDCLYAACIHKGLVNLSNPVNKIRLSTYETEGYYNSGMLLMNLPKIREEVHAQDIFSYVKKNRQLLVLPDQDILNGLYGERILPVDESLWNYDARKYKEYLLSSSGDMDMDWVMRHTAVLHYCGKRKPWHKSYYGRFSALYKHYRQLSVRYTAGGE